MVQNKKFGLLRNILKALGLSQKSSDDVIDFTLKILASEDNEHTSNEIRYPYRLRNHFLSPAELKFYLILRQIVHNRAYLGTKVNLNDIFYVKSSNQSDFRTYTNKIDRKHVDFILCDWNTMQPFLGIELDDSSHLRPDRQERDEFVDRVFRVSGLPILHIKVQRDYDLKTLAATLQPYFQQEIRPYKGHIPESSKNDKPNTCPKCGSDMVLRTVKRGENKGNQFWGCSAYPKCRTIIQISNPIS